MNSQKAERFKQWLATVGVEHLHDIKDPGRIIDRTRLLYKAKGYSDEWIEKRIFGSAIHAELIDEWKNRGAQHEKEHATITTEISKATFGLTPAQYKKHKGLKQENLRDHMDDMELILTMLGECTTKEIHRNKDSCGPSKLKADAKVGGTIAGNARKSLEKLLKRPVVSRNNYLSVSESQRKLQGCR
jgi:hypothetical protein